MPWRLKPSAYACWLSEIMLQQTTYASALPYYKRFLKKFPSVGALARANEADVLKVWEGLGYYARARNLHKAARTIVASGRALWPRSATEWAEVPGVGPYTAAALASVLNGERIPVVDGNVARVFARHWMLADEFKKLPARARLGARLQPEIDKAKVPGDFNQAMMELGALVCTPTSPACGDCPLAKTCAARSAGTQSDYPVKTAKKAVPVRKAHVIIVSDAKGRVLLAQNRDGGLLKGLWELPAAQPGPAQTQVFSHFKLELTSSRLMRTDVEFRDPKSVPLATATRKLLAAAMKLKKCLCVGALVAGLTAFGAYEEVTTSRYPDADSVYVDGIEETAYNPDGTYVTTSEQWIKVLTEKGRREESSLTVNYNARYGKAEIVSVALIGADGVSRPVDISATLKDTTDNSSASANIYDPLDRQLNCTIPGIKVGDIVHVKTRRTATKARVENEFADISVLEWSSPIVRQVVRIRAPAARPLVKTAVRHPLGNVAYAREAQADGSILHTWTATNSPQAFPEPDMPPLYTQIQHLRVSTVNDWRELSKWYWNLSLPHLVQTNAALVAKVRELSSLIPHPSSLIPHPSSLDAIYKWVAQEIRYMGLTLENVSPGYAPHDVDVTFENRYGVCRDKAALLVAMLRIAGFDAYPVLIHAGAKMDAEVPLPYFNHAIVAVRAPGDKRANRDGYILMDPTDESSRDLLPSYLSDRSYLVACPQGETLLTSPVPPATENALRIDGRGTLAADGSLVVDASIAFGGINDNAYRHALLRRRPEDRRKLFERFIERAAPGAELLTCDILPKDLRRTEEPLAARLVFRAPESVLRGETRDELILPYLSRVLGIANWLLEGSTSLEKRRFPLVVSSTARIDEKLEIDLGGALGDAISLPEPVTMAGDYAFSRAVTATNGTLVATRALAVNAVEFSPKVYDDLCEEIKRVEAAERARPVFAKDELADAHVRVIRNFTDYRFSSPVSWTLTNTVEKEILTYQGKKNSSELKFAFNPLWKNVKLLSASVKTRDGKTSRVTAKEMNTFDCGWAGAAPRYPATKELVVNLPSVEIGSVVTYTTVTTVSNAPAPFRGVFYFDAYEPTDEIVARWGDGTNEQRRVTKVKRLKSEPMQPPSVLWRDCTIVSKGDFQTAAANLRAATEVEPCVSSEPGLDGIRAIRDWMAKHVKVVGPSLYEVPLDRQLTDPKTVLAERYASRLDYVRTLCALLKGGGFDAEIVFAADTAQDHPKELELNLVTHPNVRMFASALCRVRVRTGGFLWWGGETKTYYLGTENEYTPLETTAYEGSLCLNPRTGEIEKIPLGEFSSNKVVSYAIAVRENGAVDLDYTQTVYGPAVGAFRKRYAEMLPEDRSRHYQEMLGDLAQAATATRELMTDTTGYPAKLTFSAYIPDYATVTDDMITLSVPGLAANLFPLTGSLRESPIGVGGDDPSRLEITVTFPAGYTLVEHLPERYSFAHPEQPDLAWYAFTVATKTDAQGRLVVTLVRDTKPCAASDVGKDYFALLKDWGRLASSRANRTLSVRKAK